MFGVLLQKVCIAILRNYFALLTKEDKIKIIMIISVEKTDEL